MLCYKILEIAWAFIASEPVLAMSNMVVLVDLSMCFVSNGNYTF